LSSGNLREQLVATMQGTVVVMGIGNACRGDDAAGSRVACEILEAPGVHVIDAQEVPESYLGQATQHQPDTIVLIDAVDLGSAPGSVAILDKTQMAAYWPSTHRVPLGLLTDFLERATRARVFLIAIQPRQSALFQPMSVDVSRSVMAVADVLNDVFADARRRGALECGSGAAASESEPRQGARLRRKSAVCPAALQSASRG